MRLFIAIELPKEVIEELGRIQERLNIDIVKQTFSKQHHLTLKFLGELSDSENVKDLLKKASFIPFELSLSNMGVFPDRDYIKIIWVGVEPKNKITELQEQIEELLKSLTIKDDNKFFPHITLSRVKFIKDKKEFSKILDKITPKPLKFEVNNFKLIKSELTSKGPVYTELASFR